MPKRTIRTGLLIIAGPATLLLLLAWDAVGWVPFPGIQGNIEARIDIAHGRFRELGYGLPYRWTPVYKTLLRDRYGVEFNAVAGCIVSKSLEDYVAAYNKVSLSAANLKFGHDIFREVSEEARKDWEREHEPSLKR